ncbi:MAG: hypothetical protein ACRC7S_16410 [Cetobacterium sp.]
MKNVKDGKVVGKVDAMEYITEFGGYPEVGTFTDKKDLQRFYKQLDTDMLEDWCEIEGLTYKACTDNESIHRMRVAMAILYKHFPKQTKAKATSKYAKYTLEDLVDMALQANVAVEDTDDERIMRMRLIMNLRVNGVIE